MRQFIRHPVDLPVEIGTEGGARAAAAQAHDISAGGLAVQWTREVAPGAHIRISIPCVQPAFEARARVAWCHPREGDRYELGVTFLDAGDAFLARMVEQVCHIEDYRKSLLRTEGRHISAEEAAMEWIDRFANQFPDIGAGHPH